MRLIDADELKHDLEWLECDTPVYLDVMSTIDERTTVDPVKHGQWVRLTRGWYCSSCRELVFPKTMESGTDYCPYCGAKMDEVENETN